MAEHPESRSGGGPRRGRGALLLALAPAALAAAALAAPALGDGLRPNPANHPKLLERPIEPSRYDEATRCRKRPAPGARALVRWLDQHLRGESWGINRCERLGGRRFSVHAEGRAIDWRLDAAVARERRAAMRLIRTLIARDRSHNVNALARRMGVQGLIFDCLSWWSGMEGLGKYSYCYRRDGKRRRNLDRTQAHRDHVHIELNRAGARKRTSFWRSPLGR